MKKIVLLLLLFICAETVSAQRLGNYKPDEEYDDFDPNTNLKGFGVKAGLNFSNVFGLSDINTGNRTGFHVGGLYKKPLLSWMAFQPELLFSRRAFYFVGPASPERNYVQMDYLDAPMMFYFYPLDNVTLHAGPQGSLLLGIKENKNKISTEGFNRFEFGVAGGIEFKVFFM
ncbi:MAG: PorT family protein, partial [Chitinophagaceae bacterium]